MATPLLLMASDRTTTQEATKTHFGSEESKPDQPTKSSKGTRKSSKAPNPKKQPQRGLGVAQLERLRIQERWKKLNEIPQLQGQPPLNLPHHDHQFHYLNPTTLPDPLVSVPVQYGASNYNGPMVITGSGLMGHHRVVGNASGFGYGSCGVNNVGGLVMNHVTLDPNQYGNRAPDPRFQAGAVYETSKELSSIPKIQSLSPRCCDHCIKKRFGCGNYMGFNGSGRDKSGAILPSNGSDFHGLNPESIPYFAGDRAAVAAAAAAAGGRTGGYLGRHPNLDHEGVEVRAVHRKGSSGGGVFMEYEFFPAGRGISTCPNAKDILLNMNISAAAEAASVSVGSEDQPSDITAATSYGGADSYYNPVDLSLKLSY